MNFIRESFWKAYLVVFTLTAVGNVYALFLPRSEVSYYYQTMVALLPANWLLYIFTILATAATFLSLWTLICRAFNLRRQAASFFRVLLAVRVVAECFGHNYDINFVKAVMVNNPPAGLVVIGSFVLLLFPSYKIHYDYAFTPAPKPLPKPAP